MEPTIQEISNQTDATTTKLASNQFKNYTQQLTSKQNSQTSKLNSIDEAHNPVSSQTNKPVKVHVRTAVKPYNIRQKK